MNRKQRRDELKSIPRWVKELGSAGNAYKQMVKNGITEKDLAKAEQKSYQKGIEVGKEIALRTCYAAALLAIKETFGFGKTRAVRFIRALDQKVVYAIDTDELIDEVLAEFGIQIKFVGYDPIDGRIEEVEDAGE